VLFFRCQPPPRLCPDWNSLSLPAESSGPSLSRPVERKSVPTLVRLSRRPIFVKIFFPHQEGPWSFPSRFPQVLRTCTKFPRRYSRRRIYYLDFSGSPVCGGNVKFSPFVCSRAPRRKSAPSSVEVYRLPYDKRQTAPLSTVEGWFSPLAANQLCVVFFSEMIIAPPDLAGPRPVKE